MKISDFDDEIPFKVWNGKIYRFFTPKYRIVQSQNIQVKDDNDVKKIESFTERLPPSDV